MPKTARPDVEKWATQILLNAHAIEACPDCGFKKLKFDHSAVGYAHDLAKQNRFPGLPSAKCIEAVDEVLDGLGDDCPVCT
jgi:hypothetical protein